jgi:hypothetical protein
MSIEEIEKLKDVHDKLRSILIDYNNPEYGDCIIDEICQAVGIPTTLVYYEEEISLIRRRINLL